MQLNFADAPSLMVPSLASPDWCKWKPQRVHYGGSAVPADDDLSSSSGESADHETDYSVPVAYQAATLTSITFDWLSAAKSTSWGSAAHSDQFQLQCATITADSTIDVTGTATSGLAGLIDHRQQHFARDRWQHRRQCRLCTLNGYSVGRRPAGRSCPQRQPDLQRRQQRQRRGPIGSWLLERPGYCQDDRVQRIWPDNLSSAATSLVQNTIITIDPGATLNSNAAGTPPAAARSVSLLKSQSAHRANSAPAPARRSVHSPRPAAPRRRSSATASP